MLARAARGSGALLLRSAVQASAPPRRASSGLPRNTVVLFVPQQEAWVVERMGRFHRILEPGLNILIPVLDRIRYVQSLKEIVINVPEQSAVTLDNVTLQIDGVLYLRIMDPYKASYGVEDPEYAVTQLAQTTMRSELGKLSLDKVFRERESLNANIVDAINQAADCWGIRCLRYEIKDIHVPPRVKESMQMQVEAERRKRATVLESEGTRESAINVAEGKKQAQILASEAEKAEQINQAAEWRCSSFTDCGRAICQCVLQTGQGLQHYPTAFQSWRCYQYGGSGHGCIWSPHQSPSARGPEFGFHQEWQ
ncbi:stomatin-like protein 2, mitochondrial isoform X2 [Ictidomys tridecemlineatus]|uniref:stomatin-like protein 2, mitochondrial isoform X2 n=1 Tax=Ictidomys tridecemlineatus TaxID=43179 RepID=UPI001A9E2F68|nr:stomatin-like protein 2, mitochondrial isoform X2 [Ictidomys tridecemlineatus]